MPAPPRQYAPLLKGKVRIRWEKHLPRLVLLEKYERPVKWFLRALTLAGIATSILTLPTWYFSLGLAVLLVIIEQFIERSVFCYTSLYVQPMPTFEIQPGKWQGMAYMLPPNSGALGLNGVGLVFTETQYAKHFFGLLWEWNYGQPDDKSNNIHLSFIIEPDNRYSVYLYPDLQRHTVREFAQSVEDEQLRKSPTKEHFPLVAQLILHKCLPYTQACFVNKFVESQPQHEAFWLVPCILTKAGAQVLTMVSPIVKYQFRFCCRQDPNKRDLEWHHGKRLMGL